MKKILAFLVGILLVPSLCLGIGYEQKKSVTLTRATDSQKTTAVQVPWNAISVGVFVPSVAENGAVSVEVYQHGANTTAVISGLVGASALDADEDTNWFPVVDVSDGQDAVIMASTYDPGFVDFSSFVASLRGHYIRFVIGAAQTTADSTWWVVFGSEVGGR